MNMKVVGGIAILIAAIMVWLAISASMEATAMRASADRTNTGWTKTINDMTGVTDIADGMIAGKQMLVGEFVVGAVIMLIVGAVFMIGRQRRNKDSA